MGKEIPYSSFLVPPSQFPIPHFSPQLFPHTRQPTPEKWLPLQAMKMTIPKLWGLVPGGRHLTAYAQGLRYLVCIHLVALGMMTVLRGVFFASVRSQLSDGVRGDVGLAAMAFLRGLWFDNVTACYILLLPMVAVTAGAFSAVVRRSVVGAMGRYGSQHPLLCVFHQDSQLLHLELGRIWRYDGRHDAGRGFLLYIYRRVGGLHGDLRPRSAMGGKAVAQSLEPVAPCAEGRTLGAVRSHTGLGGSDGGGLLLRHSRTHGL